MEENKDKIIYIPVEDILPNRFQPRLAFDEKELNELASSITKYGIIQPIVLRNIGDKYEIIAGERRFKASQIAGLRKVPAIINNTDDNTSAEIALLENLQRKNLTPIEEAQSYKKLIDRGFTQEEIATKLGISQSSVANKMRLLNLPKKVQDALLYGKISERHARSLLTLNNANLQENLLERIIDERLTVRQTEEEIGLLLNKDKYNNDIPGEIQKYLNIPNDDMRFMKHTFEEKIPEKVVETPSLFNIPDVVTISDERENNQIVKETEENYNINPFQTSNYSVVDRLPINSYSNIYSDIVDETIKLNEEEINDSKKDVIKVINKVREYLGSMKEFSNIINTSEVDLDDKYQIIIEIKKNN